MLGLIVRRLLVVIPTLLVVTFAIFSLLALIPGDAAVTLAGGIDAQPDAIEEIRTELKLDEPFLVQYADWLSGAVRLDFGNSLYSKQPITDELFDRMPVTLGLTALVFFIAIVLSQAVGIAGGLRPGSLLDRLLLLGSSASISMPSFWVALVLVTIFAVQLGWVPPFGYIPFTEQPGEWFRRMILPAVAMALGPSAVIARQVRRGMADTMQSAFIRTAWAKGGSTRQVVVGHALKTSAIPVVTVLGLQVSAVLGAGVIIERIFSIPGLGTYLIESVGSQDLPAVQAIAVLFVLINISLNLAIDVSYGFLNPKVRVS